MRRMLNGVHKNIQIWLDGPHFLDNGLQVQFRARNIGGIDDFKQTRILIDQTHEHIDIDASGIRIALRDTQGFTCTLCVERHGIERNLEESREGKECDSTY